MFLCLIFFFVLGICKVKVFEFEFCFDLEGNGRELFCVKNDVVFFFLLLFKNFVFFLL